MRKKIPTITRPDTAYAATLRQDVEKIPERGKAERTVSDVGPSVASATEGPGRPFLEAPAQDPEGLNPRPDTAVSPAKPQLATGTSSGTRKIDIRVNALQRQEAALLACGVDPAHVVRAALRRAVKSWRLSPVHIPPSDERRTRITGWQARTSLAVDKAPLKDLLRDHDPLDVLSKWALIRGQVEPRIWAEIDALIEELKNFAAAPHDSDNAETTDIER